MLQRGYHPASTRLLEEAQRLSKQCASCLGIVIRQGVRREVADDERQRRACQALEHRPGVAGSSARSIEVADLKLELAEIDQSASVRFAAGSFQARDLREPSPRPFDVPALKIRHCPKIGR